MATRRDAVFCSDACRKAASRANGSSKAGTKARTDSPKSGRLDWKRSIESARASARWLEENPYPYE